MITKIVPQIYKNFKQRESKVTCLSYRYAMGNIIVKLYNTFNSISRYDSWNFLVSFKHLADPDSPLGRRRWFAGLWLVHPSPSGPPDILTPRLSLSILMWAGTERPAGGPGPTTATAVSLRHSAPPRVCTHIAPSAQHSLPSCRREVISTTAWTKSSVMIDLKIHDNIIIQSTCI